MKKNLQYIFLSGTIIFIFFTGAIIFHFFPSLHYIFHRITYCRFKKLTGRPCATCGFTRCVLFFFTGKIFYSILVNPLCFFLIIYILLVFFINLYYFLTKKDKYFILFSKTTPKKTILITLGILTLNWIYKLIMSFLLANSKLSILI